MKNKSRLSAFYSLTRDAFPQKNRLQAGWYALTILRRIRRRERQEGKLPVRFE